MKYNGFEVKEFTSDKPVVFDPPKQMLCWNNEGDIPGKLEVHAYLPASGCCPVKCWNCNMAHCAEIPEISKEPKPRRATNRELAKWLAHGNGEKSYAFADGSGYSVSCDFIYDLTEENRPLPEHDRLLVRKWDDTEWHEPTADYMGLEG